jgi:hypothetical protein
MERHCPKCKEDKDISEFRKNKFTKHGFDYLCKDCKQKYQKEYINRDRDKYLEKSKLYYTIHKETKNKKSVEYWRNNSEKRKLNTKKYRIKHAEEIKIRQEVYHKNPENREKINKTMREWYNKNKIYRRNKIKDKLGKNLGFKLSIILRCRINNAIKSQKFKKTRKTGNIDNLIGCTVVELKNYIESKFLPTMTWENYGKYWHIDHIIPCNSFDLTNEEDQKKCFHYTNMQPLFATTQLINGIEYIGNLNKQEKILKYGI